MSGRQILLSKVFVSALAVSLSVNGLADVSFGKTYEAHNADGLTLTRWDDFYMGATVAIPVVGDDFVAEDIVLKPGNYIDYGEPYVWSEEDMWNEYGSKFYEAYEAGALDLESDVVGKTKVWYWQNWDGADDMELITEIWGKSFEKSPANDVFQDRKWIMIPTGSRPQAGVHKFTVIVSNENTVASHLVSFKKASDQKAVAATVLFNANGGRVDEYGRVVRLKTAIGKLPDPAPRTGYSFVGWYTAKTKGTKISASTKVTKAMTVYARWAAKKYNVSAAVSAKAAGAVSGAGLKAYGSKVALKAAAKKGYVFVKWENLDDPDTPWPSAEKCRQPSVTFKQGTGAVSVRAMFARAAEDKAISLAVDQEDAWHIDDDPGRAIYIVADSLSYPSVSVKGQPAGVGLVRVAGTDCHYLLKVTDSSKLKPGVYTAKITAKNRSGKSVSKSVRIVAPNSTAALGAGLVAGLKTSTLLPYVFDGGMKTSVTLADLGVEVFATNGWKLASVTGLPTGLSWNGTAIVGAASKTGLYTVTFTMKKTVGTGKKAKTYTSTASATFKVEALLPAALAGTYNGFANTNVLTPDDEDEGTDEWADEGDDEEIYGYYTPILDGWASSAKITVTTAGKVTANIGGVALSGSGFDSESNGVYAVTLKKTQKITKGYLKGGINVWVANLEIDTNAGWDALQLVGSYYGYNTKMPSMTAPAWISAQRSPFALDEAKEVARAVAASGVGGVEKFALQKAKGGYAYDLVCASCMIGGKVSLTAKAKSSGTVTLSGKIGTKAVSGTAVLGVSPEVVEMREDYDEDDNPLEVPVRVRTAIARFFSGNFVIEATYTLNDGEVVDVVGKVWKK
jgi:uncharacterized repeat protein (TIGR02543 family)